MICVGEILFLGTIFESRYIYLPFKNPIVCLRCRVVFVKKHFLQKNVKLPLFIELGLGLGLCVSA